jgi:hypothetical protein
MESFAMTSPVEPVADGGAAGRVTPPEQTRPSRTSMVARSDARARPGMSFGHDVLLALIMAVAMAATVFLYR